MAPTVTLPGVDDKLHKILEAKMDEVPNRKQAREAFKDIQLGIDHILFKVWCWMCLFLDLFVFVELMNHIVCFIFTPDGLILVRKK